MNPREAAAVILAELDRTWTLPDVLTDPDRAVEVAWNTIRAGDPPDSPRALEDRHRRLEALAAARHAIVTNDRLPAPDPTPERCPHDDDPTLCPPCQRAADQGHGAAIPTAPPKPRTMTARRTSNCPGRCHGTLILEGVDRITYDDDLEMWVCQTCAPS